MPGDAIFRLYGPFPSCTFQALLVTKVTHPSFLERASVRQVEKQRYDKPKPVSQALATQLTGWLFQALYLPLLPAALPMVWGQAVQYQWVLLFFRSANPRLPSSPHHVASSAYTAPGSCHGTESKSPPFIRGAGFLMMLSACGIIPRSLRSPGYG